MIEFLKLLAVSWSSIGLILLLQWVIIVKSKMHLQGILSKKVCDIFDGISEEYPALALFFRGKLRSNVEGKIIGRVHKEVPFFQKMILRNLLALGLFVAIGMMVALSLFLLFM